MAKRFSISESMLNGISKNTEKVSTIEAKENFKLEYIDIDKIVRNKKNFYEISNIEDLVEDISINGLNHNLVVRPIGNEQYELISGERRYTALKELISKGNEKFRKVPCKTLELNDLDSEIVLIQANAQSRELSESDKLKQVQRLTELYNMKKKKGEKIGKVRDIISKDTGLSPTQVGRYTTINKSLIPELKSVLEQGNLTIANASEFAVLSEENQNIILDIIKNNVSINKNEANELKNKLKKIEQEKESLIKKEEEHLNEIKKLTLKNEEINRDLDKKIDDINKIANNKAKEIAIEFKNDKNKIKKGNVELKKEINEIKKDESKLELNQELKIRLKGIRKEIGKVAGLMANNTIIDDGTLKEVNFLKEQLRFLNEQVDLYTNQIKHD
ncbi:ParB/RepB/Spo0J family partition protein [Romboutsia sp. 1001713B170131_170501_G6]|uniref:ParB/RepB/Spo0J family partition protein n=1 Tax=Romboutsia sp. 1001713B170131_170501_G6 TaxID=2787108 RepID=UPI0018A9E426